MRSPTDEAETRVPHRLSKNSPVQMHWCLQSEKSQVIPDVVRVKVFMPENMCYQRGQLTLML
ncbi:hypothetical protein E2C01_034564 [Portunus trituberculatus]|uniref:Uncharacterized protein n=1 Tax=Portunus trituberculatus TaxID=210409 RepID=A0A5B7F5Y5_PORTR|nr:hypothetical protein [Portunus trituberculatus]